MGLEVRSRSRLRGRKWGWTQGMLRSMGLMVLVFTSLIMLATHTITLTVGEGISSCCCVL